MRSSITRRRGRASLALPAILALVLVSVPAMAQHQTGNLHGVVVDSGGAALPGVTVTLSGIGAPRAQVTDNEGQFRFIGLSPGQYSVKAELAGLGTASRNNVDVNVGANTEIRLPLTPAVAETITVTAETPLLDVRRAGTGTTVNRVELEQIPTARDPWTVLQQVPGVLVDRINVGGNESGQQSNYTGKGATGAQSVWNIDGVAVTDMSATGSSNFYYNFDSFEEMQVVTGGADPRIQTPGVQLNLVTKRGTNSVDGSARFLITQNEWQAEASVPQEARSYLARANEIDGIEDYGAEIGGPLWRDKLWLWAAYGKNQIDLLTAAAPGSSASFDNTTLEAWTGKLNAQLFQNNSAVLFYNDSVKAKQGRNVGPTRPPETGWNQSGIGGTPTSLWKFEDTHIFSPNLYLTGLYSKVKAGFQLTPAGGLEVDTYLEDNVWRRSYLHYETNRPQEQYRLDGSAFFGTGGMNHELKFGFGYRDAPVESLSAWPGSGSYGVFETGQRPLAVLTRQASSAFGTDYTDFYIGDTMLMRNLTVLASLRYDLQRGSNLASTTPANPLVPDLLPAISYGGDPQELEWSSISPRLGVTYSMGNLRKTLLRAGYNRYVDQLGTGVAGAANPLALSGIYYFWDDRNADKTIQRPEIDFASGLLGFYGLDPSNPAAPIITSRLDYDMNPTTTDELILGVEHELRTDFTIGLTASRRTINDSLWTRPEKTQGRGDYYTTADYELAGQVTGSLPDGTSYSAPYYRVRSSLAVPTFYVITNRPDYKIDYTGLELAAVKRLSHRWMMRGNVSWNDWTVEAGEGSFYDPTTQETAAFNCLGPGCEGSFVQASGATSGAKRGIYINSRWSYNFSGIYQFPWDITFGASLLGREGYPVPWAHLSPVVREGEGRKRVYVTALDRDRLENVFNLDLRLAKDFKFRAVGLTLALDAFNVTDERTVLQRENRNGVALGRIRELQSPRVFRLGARVVF